MVVCCFVCVCVRGVSGVWVDGVGESVGGSVYECLDGKMGGWMRGILSNCSQRFSPPSVPKHKQQFRYLHNRRNE